VAPAPQFIALPLPPSTAGVLPDIRIELRRGATTVSIIWPGQAASECGAWLREWLR
jgi:transposase